MARRPGHSVPDAARPDGVEERGVRDDTLLIAMQAVPEELYEAARVDGASARQSLRRITVPLILPTIALVVLLLVVGSYLAFDQFYIITRGGPNNSTITATYWIYNQAFVAFKFGYSTAMSVVLMLFLVVLGAIQLRILRRDVTGSMRPGR